MACFMVLSSKLIGYCQGFKNYNYFSLWVLQLFVFFLLVMFPLLWDSHCIYFYHCFQLKQTNKQKTFFLRGSGKQWRKYAVFSDYFHFPPRFTSWSQNTEKIWRALKRKRHITYWYNYVVNLFLFSYVKHGAVLTILLKESEESLQTTI